MRKPMATPVTPAALPHIQRFRRAGAKAPWVITRPVLDAVLGSVVLAAFMAAMMGMWISQGSGL